MDRESVDRFLPSGVGCEIHRTGQYTILHNHGLYWSDEKNPDTSHDMHASVIVFRENRRVFVGRGYKYLGFRTDPKHSGFSFQHWTGTMGDDQITHFGFNVVDDELKLTVTQGTTR